MTDLTTIHRLQRGYRRQQAERHICQAITFLLWSALFIVFLLEWSR